MTTAFAAFKIIFLLIALLQMCYNSDEIFYYNLVILTGKKKILWTVLLILKVSFPIGTNGFYSTASFTVNAIFYALLINIFAFIFLLYRW